MANNNSKRVYGSKRRPKTRINHLTVIVICAVFVVVGLFLVYRSFAAIMPR